jgi:hypothetical protein
MSASRTAAELLINSRILYVQLDAEKIKYGAKSGVKVGSVRVSYSKF